MRDFEATIVRMRAYQAAKIKEWPIKTTFRDQLAEPKFSDNSQASSDLSESEPGVSWTCLSVLRSLFDPFFPEE